MAYIVMCYYSYYYDVFWVLLLFHLFVECLAMPVASIPNSFLFHMVATGLLPLYSSIFMVTRILFRFLLISFNYIVFIPNFLQEQQLKELAIVLFFINVSTQLHI